MPPLGKSCSGNVKSTCWSPGVNDVDCPGHGLCCFDGCANTCRNEKATQNPGFFEDNVIPLIENENGKIGMFLPNKAIREMVKNSLKIRFQ